MLALPLADLSNTYREQWCKHIWEWQRCFLQSSHTQSSGITKACSDFPMLFQSLICQPVVLPAAYSRERGIPRACIFRCAEHPNFPMLTMGCVGTPCFQNPHLQLRSVLCICMNTKPEHYLSISGRGQGTCNFQFCLVSTAGALAPKSDRSPAPSLGEVHYARYDCQKDISRSEKRVHFFRAL